MNNISITYMSRVIGIFVFFGLFNFPCLAKDFEIPGDKFRLSVNGSGDKVLAAWRGIGGDWEGKLFFSDGLKRTKNIKFPSKSVPHGFSYDGNGVIYVNFVQGKHKVWVRNIDSGNDVFAFESDYGVSFLSEYAVGQYIYLLDMPTGSYAKWVEREKDKVVSLGKKYYNFAAMPNFLNSGVFVLIPRNPPELDILKGQVSDSVTLFINKDTGAISCAKDDSVTCVRADHFFGSGKSFSKIFLKTLKKNCQVGDAWIDVRSLSTSRNGKLAAFSSNVTGENNLIIVRPEEGCSFSLLTN
ncbi:hypothetical protein [Duganella sp. HH101]|uniref:hypothetical protein n=1 Tax=Duganella sp. HH101 TaxID=1781066 RepID=UPI000893DD27|nr:hypothetical protein [Duganella sp. HH101]OFA00215.1 hypothetical protein DUGA2_50480 [Duganella sp. HH101]